MPETGFLPFASVSHEVAKLLSKHIAAIRGSSIDSVLRTYGALEPGFRFVFERELCLRHDELTPADHRGKRPLKLVGYEKLVQSVAYLEDALRVLARILEKGRVEAVKAANKAEKGQHATKPLVIHVSDLLIGAEVSSRQDIELRPGIRGIEASWKAPLHISFTGLEEIECLKDLHDHQRLNLKQPLRSCVFLGGGGGSDVIQAAALAKLITRANSLIEVLAVISIRTLHSKSSTAGQKRRIWQANDPNQDLLESSNGDLIIKPDHRGNARFVEDTISDDFENVRLVIDDKSQDQLRRSRYEGAIGKDVDSMIVVDTGGDVLGGMEPSAKRTPDQDYRTQLATAQIAAAKNLNAMVAIAAIGVDAPPNAQQKLEASNAVCYRLTEEDKEYLKGLYSRWHFNGTADNLKRYPEHYGRTPFAMLASFELKPGEGGSYHALPLPESVIKNFDNPWACITWVTPEMSCLVLANQARLLEVIAPASEY